MKSLHKFNSEPEYMAYAMSATGQSTDHDSNKVRYTPDFKVYNVVWENGTLSQGAFLQVVDGNNTFTLPQVSKVYTSDAISSSNISLVDEGNPYKVTISGTTITIKYSEPWLTFVPANGFENATQSISINDINSGVIECSADGGETWTVMNTGTKYAIGSGLCIRQKGDISYNPMTPEPVFHAENTTPFNVQGKWSKYFDGSHKVYAGGLFQGLPIVSAKNLIFDVDAQIFADEELSTLGMDTTYAWLFYNCASMTTPPTNLHAPSIKRSHYYMFYNCPLTSLPIIPKSSTALEGCFNSMFYGAKIASIPNDYLPATTLEATCYGSMFSHCTNLTSLPTLSATEIPEGAYASMYAYCSSLTTVPKTYLPATKVGYRGYISMFQNCTALTQAPIINASLVDNASFSSMFAGCKELVVCPDMPNSYDNVGGNTFNAMFSECIKLKDNIPAQLIANSVQSNHNGCFQKMFYGCTSLTTAPNLPSTVVIGASSYSSMFRGCTSLVTPPTKISATSAVNGNFCEYMFYNCKALTKSPSIEIQTTISTSTKAFPYMFYGCTALTEITCYYKTPTTTTNSSWLTGASATGTIHAPSGVTYPTGTSGKPTGWTVVNDL